MDHIFPSQDSSSPNRMAVISHDPPKAFKYPSMSWSFSASKPNIRKFLFPVLLNKKKNARFKRVVVDKLLDNHILK